MTALYPEPPHLTVAIYCERAEIDVFAEMHQLAISFGCVPTNVVETAPIALDFEFVSDLGQASEVSTLDPNSYARLTSGRNAELRAVRAGFIHRKFGSVVVEYLQKAGPGFHPVGLSLNAQSLGIPDSSWSARQRKSAYAVADWSRSLLDAATSQCGALYGAIGVEFSLPNPWKIRTGKPRLTTEIFVSSELTGQNEFLGRDLRNAFSEGGVEMWGSGTFFSGWFPFNSQRKTVSDVTAVTDIVRTALKRALK